MLFGPKFTKEIKVDGMKCAHCAANVEAALKKLDGVKSVNVDLASKTVTIKSTVELGNAAISEAVTAAGYTML